MILQAVVTKYIPTNAYFYIDDTTKHGFLIDPGAQADKLQQIAAEKGFVIEKILLTHGHFDHIGAVTELQKAWRAEVCMHENGKAYAENPEWNLSIQTGKGIVLENVTYLPDNAVITLKANPEYKLQSIEKPVNVFHNTYVNQTADEQTETLIACWLKAVKEMSEAGE